MKCSLLAFVPVMTLLFCVACSKSSQENVTAPPDNNPPVVIQDSTPQTKYDITLLDNCNLFLTAPATATMQRQDYNELSGIAASHINTGVLYVQEDGEGINTVVLTNAKGEDLGHLILDNVSMRDMEDIRVGPGPDAGKSYIYLADIGDNDAGHQSVFVYRFPEPVLKDLAAGSNIHIPAIDKIELVYPKSPVNAETLMIDPVTKDLFIASKETSKSTLYTAPYPQSLTGVTTLKPVVKTNFDLITSGDISPGGDEIVMRNKGQIWYWKRSAGQGIPQTILNAPQVAPYAGNEHQGEGICFAADAGGYFTDTEIRDYPTAVSTISFYKRK